MENIHSNGIKWYRKSNLREAKIIFCFSKDSESDIEAYEQDKLMSLTAKNLKVTFPKLRIMLVLNTIFKKIIDQDSLYSDIETISPREMSEFILASSLENPGLGTTLQHLLTMKRKEVSCRIINASYNDLFL